MKPLLLEDIIKFLKENIEPLADDAYGPGYRASVYLLDGTYLPCVLFRNASTIVDKALRRFKEEQELKIIFSRSTKSKYREIVKTFVASGNRVNYYDIAKVEKSPFAFPLSVQNQIKGETAMSWTAFVAKFKDGRLLNFGTTWNWEFFDIPNNYSIDEATEIINNSYVTKNGDVIMHRSIGRTIEWNELAEIHKDKQFFVCYVDHL